MKQAKGNSWYILCTTSSPERGISSKLAVLGYY
jgi:hypothetical protein